MGWRTGSTECRSNPHTIKTANRTLSGQIPGQRFALEVSAVPAPLIRLDPILQENYLTCRFSVERRQFESAFE